MKNFGLSFSGVVGLALYGINRLTGGTPVRTPEEAAKVKRPIYLYNPFTEEQLKDCIMIKVI
jgi:hypothetical protein